MDEKHVHNYDSVGNDGGNCDDGDCGNCDDGDGGDCGDCGDCDDNRGIVINGNYGGLSVPTPVFRLLGIEPTSYYDFNSIELRTHPKFVDFIENNKNCKNYDGLRDAYVEYIPKEAFDAEAVIINEYDGSESVSIDESKMSIYKSRKTMCEIKELIKDLPECENKELLQQKIEELCKKLKIN
jgi:hypothetical protein